MRFLKRKLHVLFFAFFMLLQEKQRKREHTKWKHAKKTYKNSAFKVVIQKSEK